MSEDVTGRDWHPVGQILFGEVRILLAHRDGRVRLKLRRLTPRDPEGRRSHDVRGSWLSVFLDTDACDEFRRLFMEAERQAATHEAVPGA